MNEVKLTREYDCFYLTQSLLGMSLYQRTKAIKKFVNNETKILEECVETEIRAIFNRNGIIVHSTEESALNDLFSALKSKNKGIEIVDLFKSDKVDDNCVLIGVSPNKITIWLEEDYLLECGIKVVEKDL